MRERSNIAVLTIVKSCEARGGVFKSQEGSRHHFSPLGRCSESRAGRIKYQETLRKQFSVLEWCCEARTGLFKCREGPRW